MVAMVTVEMVELVAMVAEVKRGSVPIPGLFLPAATNFPSPHFPSPHFPSPDFPTTDLPSEDFPSDEFCRIDPLSPVEARVVGFRGPAAVVFRLPPTGMARTLGRAFPRSGP